MTNRPADLAHTVYCAPAEWKNLNRVFLGKSDGTLAKDGDTIRFVIDGEWQEV